MQELSFKEKLEAPLTVLWTNYKWFLIIFSLLILAYKFKDVIIDILLKNSKRVLSETSKKSDSLLKEENKMNEQANNLIEESNKLNSNKPSVNEDWYLKK